MSKHDIFPIPSYFVQPRAEECVFGSRRKLKVSVLSANLKKMQVLQFFWQLHQAFFFGIVVLD